MTASNTYARFASVALPSADGCRSSSVVAVGCVLIVIGAYCFCPSVFAQTPDSRTPDEPTKSWTATTDVKGNNLNSAQFIESHSQNGNQTVDKRSAQIRGVDGHLEPYQDIETETLQVDATTVRTITRTFGHDLNGKTTLVQVTEEERRTLLDGNSNAVRITSNADLNGTLQPVRCEIVETKSIGTDMEETNTTVMLRSINGGFAPAMKTHDPKGQARTARLNLKKPGYFSMAQEIGRRAKCGKVPSGSGSITAIPRTTFSVATLKASSASSLTS